jgi:glutathione S-transferase
MTDYVPPKVWTWKTQNGGTFASINRPIAGATHDKELPVGRHPLQLYSLATPNGQKVTILLEELLALGHQGAEYDAWLIQMGSAPYLGGGFGHFYAYAPTKIEYAIDRFAMETKRQLDVLDKQLAEHEYIAGDEYTIADMAIWPWYGGLVKGRLYEAGEFLSVQDYKHVVRWANAIEARPAVQRGRRVNRVSGEPSEQLRERHDASDLD